MITKSEYMLYLRHPAWLWLKKNASEKLPPADAATQAKYDAGYAFEPYVESQFDGAVHLGFEGQDEYHTLPRRTIEALGQGARTLVQPRFEWGEFTCICDIVTVVDESTVDLYEIKSSTRVKPEHLYDLAFQAAVLEDCGYNVRDVYVAHVNNQYVRRGAIDPVQLATIEQVTEQAKELHDYTRTNRELAVQAANASTMPDPNPDLAGLGAKKVWLEIYNALYPQPTKEWPAGTHATIDKAKITEFLQKLEFPLYFFDYETMQALIPYFDGHRPYQQVPFQYSIHILDSPGSELRHVEYLHSEPTDPAGAVAEHLVRDLGTAGSIIVWNQSFEKSRNVELGTMYPQYRDALTAINKRVVDLMVPFKSKWYDDPRFEGSVSIKNVLPVLCPELSYKELGIQEGNSAQRLWMEAVLDETRDDKQQVLADLSEYCGLDTLAMVKIYQVLEKHG